MRLSGLLYMYKVLGLIPTTGNKTKQKKQTFLGVLLRQMIMLESERQIGVGLSFHNTSGLMINSKVM